MFLVRQQTPSCAAGLPCFLISGTQRSQIAELPGPPGRGRGGDEAQVARCPAFPEGDHCILLPSWLGRT